MRSVVTIIIASTLLCCCSGRSYYAKVAFNRAEIKDNRLLSILDSVAISNNSPNEYHILTITPNKDCYNKLIHIESVPRELLLSFIRKGEKYGLTTINHTFFIIDGTEPDLILKTNDTICLYLPKSNRIGIYEDFDSMLDFTYNKYALIQLIQSNSPGVYSKRNIGRDTLIVDNPWLCTDAKGNTIFVTNYKVIDNKLVRSCLYSLNGKYVESLMQDRVFLEINKSIKSVTRWRLFQCFIFIDPISRVREQHIVPLEKHTSSRLISIVNRRLSQYNPIIEECSIIPIEIKVDF